MSIRYATLIIIIGTLWPSTESDAIEVIPTQADVAYGTGRELVDLYLPMSTSPAAVYIYGHAKGQHHKIVPKKAILRCRQSGVAFLSIVANDTKGTAGQDLLLKQTWLKAIDWVVNNAERYNLDKNNIFVGGRSLGSIGSFPAALDRWELIRGIYSAQAIPKRGDEMATLVHANSPPCFFVFKTAPGSTNHDPVHGTKVKRAYEKAGIGDRFSMRTEVPVGQWFDGLTEFVQSHMHGGESPLRPR